MAREQLKTLTEPMYYLLLALIQPRHGYGIMQCIAEITEEQVQVGAGTLYGLLARFEGEGIIAQLMEQDRKKIYQITPKGAEVLTEEYLRLNRMVENGKRFFDSTGTMLPIDYESARQEAEALKERESSAKEAAPEREKAPEAPETEKQGAQPREENKGENSKKGIGFKGFRKGIPAT